MRTAAARQSLAIGCVLAALALVVLDASVANVALPAIARALQVAPAAAVQVVTAYQLGLVMALLPGAALGEALGARRVYTAGVALFLVASVLCALAPSLPLLVAARFAQGLGGAAVMALGVTLLRALVGERELGRAIGWNALVVALASASGPTLGALVLSSLGWPALFALNLPLGLAVLGASRALPDVPGSGRSFDRVSAALNGAAFGGWVLAAELMAHHAALSATLALVGALAMALLVRRERPKLAPLVPLDLLGDGAFRLSALASVCGFIGQGAAMISLPFTLQRELGDGVLATGLSMTPWPLSAALAASAAGRLADRIPGAWLGTLGAALLAAGLLGAALREPTGRAFDLLPLLALCGVGFGLFQVTNNRAMFLAAPRARSGAAGGAQSTARLSGQTLGGVAMTLLFTWLPVELAPRVGLALGALAMLTAAAVSTLRATAPLHAR